MIKKYQFGTPIETDAVVEQIGLSEGIPEFGQIAADTETGFSFTCTLAEEDAVYGLGEAMRGINKRGHLYVSLNTDQPHHHEDTHSLYGTHNFVVIDGRQRIGLFFDCPSKMSFDIGYTRSDVMTVTSEYPDLYLYVITGDSVKDIVRSFRRIIGRSYLPPFWGMGFGQSRWGYVTEEDFRNVVRRYREAGIPLDAVYMDIDYMERYKDFTVNQKNFPDFAAFVAEMKAQNVHLVPIIDAAVKLEKGYDVCEEGVERGYFCTDEDGKPFVTAAWPDRTYLPDVLNPEARRWFGDKYQFLLDQGIDGFWNDMNEPAIFYTERSLTEFRKALENFIEQSRSGEVRTFEVMRAAGDLYSEEDYRHFYHKIDGEMVSHDRVHNLYGYNMTRAAGEAFERLCPDRRILMYSRSSYIGMHRYGGIWTGDNKSWWAHLLLNIKMMPSLNMCGFLYSGADIGGFGSNTTRDLVLRWLAFGVFTPLMRNHSALGTREQECYQFEHVEDFIHVIGVRYRLLPYLYSELVKSALADEMYFRALAFDYPEDPMAKEVEDQLMLGEGLMVTPVYTQNATGRYVYLPEDMLFVKFLPDGTLYQEQMEKGVHFITVKLNEVPMFVKKEHFVPLAKAVQNVTELTDEFTLVGWTTGKTSYTLYHDDGYGKDYENPEHYRVIVKE